jgi:hypothetical protein
MMRAILTVFAPSPRVAKTSAGGRSVTAPARMNVLTLTPTPTGNDRIVIAPPET